MKAQLKEFYKYTHPDLFGNAPQKIQETNSEAMKSLNEYLRNISTESTHVDKLTLTFYVKPGKLCISESFRSRRHTEGVARTRH
jgi:hypothetical protein